MPRLLKSFLILPLLCSAQVAAAPERPVSKDFERQCSHDREGLLALSETEFDQDIGGGWRTVAATPGCERAAADLIRDYRLANDSRSTTLFWHEGQLRASAGEAQAAIELMGKAYHTNEPFDTGWNAYVDASIAFLRKDRRALAAARAKLASTAWPAGLLYVAEDGSKREGPWPGWPANLDVVDGLIACFDKPYAEAYSVACRKPAT